MSGYLSIVKAIIYSSFIVVDLPDELSARSHVELPRSFCTQPEEPGGHRTKLEQEVESISPTQRRGSSRRCSSPNRLRLVLGWLCPWKYEGAKPVDRSHFTQSAERERDGGENIRMMVLVGFGYDQIERIFIIWSMTYWMNQQCGLFHSRTKYTLNESCLPIIKERITKKKTLARSDPHTPRI
jgi:hypothetical protein